MIPLASTIELPIGYIVTAISSLSGVIVTMALIIYHAQKSRLDSQDKIIAHLQSEVSQMRKGCGQPNCFWK